MPTYGDAVAAARKSLAKARLADPENHFPYRLNDVRSMLEENPAMGPAGPDDDRVRAEDFISPEIADASAAYIDAQKAYLEKPDVESKAAYDQAGQDLVSARQAHRVNREGGQAVAIRSRRAGE